VLEAINVFNTPILDATGYSVDVYGSSRRRLSSTSRGRSQSATRFEVRVLITSRARLGILVVSGRAFVDAANPCEAITAMSLMLEEIRQQPAALEHALSTEVQRFRDLQSTSNNTGRGSSCWRRAEPPITRRSSAVI
jgi:hypothetical protein